MKTHVLVALLFASTLTAGTATAQPAPFNPIGVTMGHWHITSKDVDANKKVCVLGIKVKQELFGSNNALYEKVTRYKIERGYAYVKSSQSELTGWVNNAALLWRLPPVKTEPEAAPGTVAPEPPAGPAEEEPGIPEAPEPTAMEVPPTPAPTLTSTPAAGATPTPRGAGRSLFDPY